MNRYSIGIWGLRLLQGVVFILAIALFLIIKKLVFNSPITDCIARPSADPNAELLRSLFCQFIESWYIAIPLLFVIFLFIINHVIGNFLYFGRLIRQKKRSLMAEHIMAEKDDTKLHFGVYLRPFEQDTVMQVKKTLWWYLSARGGIYNRDIESVDTLVSAEFAMRFPVLGLDKRNEGFGAAKLETTDKDWFDLVCELMDRATVIIIFPGLTNGITKELGLAYQLHREKLICAITPEKLHSSTEQSLTEYWQALIDWHQKVGIKMPPYNEDGAIFTYDKQGELKQNLPFLAASGRTNLRKSCQDILDSIL